MKISLVDCTPTQNYVFYHCNTLVGYQSPPFAQNMDKGAGEEVTERISSRKKLRSTAQRQGRGSQSSSVVRGQTTRHRPRLAASGQKAGGNRLNLPISAVSSKKPS